MRYPELSAPRVADSRPMTHARPRRGRLAAAFALLAILAGVGGCSANGGLDDSAGAVFLVVSTIEAISDPFGDVITSSGSILEDRVRVDLVARLKNPTDVTAPTMQEIVIDRYEVTFSRTDGGSAVPAGFTRGINQKVRITEHGSTTERITQFDIVLAPATIKSQPPIAHLVSPGIEPGTGYVNIQATATIRFYGQTLSGDPITASATIGIDFANFADEN